MKKFLKNLIFGKLSPTTSTPKKQRKLKLNEILSAIENGDFSEETREALFVALRRSNGDEMRCQHCWLFADKIFQRYGAKRLRYIIDLLEVCPVRFPNISKYVQSEIWIRKGQVYRAVTDYQAAIDCFRHARYLLIEHWREIDKPGGCTWNADFPLLETLLIAQKFSYSRELEEIFEAVAKDPVLPFCQVRIVKACAAAVIAREHGDITNWKNAVCEAQEAVCGIVPFGFSALLKRHRIHDKPQIPEAFHTFIRREFAILKKEEAKP